MLDMGIEIAVAKSSDSKRQIVRFRGTGDSPVTKTISRGDGNSEGSVSHFTETQSYMDAEKQRVEPFLLLRRINA